MIVIGLTGSIGMGKSAVSDMFRRAGIPVFCADAEVHRLQGPGGALLPAIESRFPESTGPHGVDRQALGAMVLGKPVEIRALEAIIHPAVHMSRQRWLKAYRSRPIVVLDIPLLLEKAQRGKAIRGIDVIVVVSAPGWMQAKRVLRRAGMTRRRLMQIRHLQRPDREKRARADHVIETGRPMVKTRAQVMALIACLRRSKRR